MKAEGAHGTRELEGLVRREVLELALEELSLVLLASTHDPRRGVLRGYLICGYVYSRAVICAPRSQEGCASRLPTIPGGLSGFAVTQLLRAMLVTGQ